MDKRVINNIMQFMVRVPLQGAEAASFHEAMLMLQAEATRPAERKESVEVSDGPKD